ncbi:MAG TPA: hypothetical protein VFS00_11190, partial [Polyangiaceae bacterium]|nr:hypothetical protein [Polyangiaceae bacterium]
LLRLAAAERPENRAAMQAFVDRWHPLARRAVEALAPLLPGGAALAGAVDPCAEGIVALGLRLPGARGAEGERARGDDGARAADGAAGATGEAAEGVGP